MSVGAVLASGLTVRLLGPLGWRGTFEAYAFGGILWSVAFYLWFRDTPEEHPGVNAEECKLIRGDLKPEPAAAHALADPELDAGALEPVETTPAPAGLAVFLTMLTTVSMWALCARPSSGRSVMRSSSPGSPRIWNGATRSRSTARAT